MVYSKKTGLQKTGKNLLVMFLLPAILYLLNNLADFLPDKYLVYASPFVGGIVYILKNYYENR